MQLRTKKRIFVFMVFLLAAVFATAGAALAAPIYVSSDTVPLHRGISGMLTA